jgi:hypothetical protein
MEDYQSRLATSSIDDFKQVLDDAIHSFSAQRNVASAVASVSHTTGWESEAGG